MANYYLIDEIIVPLEFEEVFKQNMDKFKEFYQSVSGVISVKYLKTTLEAFTRQNSVEMPGAEGLTMVSNPKGAYLLQIVFNSQEDFQNYHDFSDTAKQIHRRIAHYFGGKQLTIRAALHGYEI